MTQRHQAIIESAYNTPILKMYGYTELGVLFIQNSQGKFLHHTRNNILELRPVFPQRRIYELIVTSWKNQFMPLLRYSTGDLVQIHAEQNAQGLFTEADPLKIERLHGRINDMVTLANSEVLTAKELDDEIFRSLPTAFQYEYRRGSNSTPDRIHVVSACHGETATSALDKIPDTVDILPGCTIPVKRVQSLATQISGKFVSVR